MSDDYDDEKKRESKRDWKQLVWRAVSSVLWKLGLEQLSVLALCRAYPASSPVPRAESEQLPSGVLVWEDELALKELRSASEKGDDIFEREKLMGSPSWLGPDGSSRVES